MSETTEALEKICRDWMGEEVWLTALRGVEVRDGTIRVQEMW